MEIGNKVNYMGKIYEISGIFNVSAMGGITSSTVMIKNDFEEITVERNLVSCLKTIELSKHTWDHETEFKIAGVRGKVSLYRDYKKKDDGIYWGLQHGAMLKAHYTDEERAHQKRFNAMEPIQKGEVVLIDGNQYKARILGDYVDCVIFDPIG